MKNYIVLLITLILAVQNLSVLSKDDLPPLPDITCSLICDVETEFISSGEPGAHIPRGDEIGTDVVVKRSFKTGLACPDDMTCSLGDLSERTYLLAYCKHKINDGSEVWGECINKMKPFNTPTNRKTFKSEDR